MKLRNLLNIAVFSFFFISRLIVSFLIFYSVTWVIFNWLSYFFHICSVLLVSNKWIHERGQEFRRPCGLTEVDWSTPKGHTKKHTHTYTTNSCALILEMMQLYNTYITVLSLNFLTWLMFCEKMMILLCGI